MTKPIAQRLRETSAQGQDIYGIHCELELEAAGEIERLERDLVAAKADKEHFQNAYVALAQRVSDEPGELLKLANQLKALDYVEDDPDMYRDIERLCDLVIASRKSAEHCKERMGFSPLHGFGPQCELPAGHEGLNHVSNSVLNRDER